MADTSVDIDVSQIAMRRKAVGFTAFAAMCAVPLILLNAGEGVLGTLPISGGVAPVLYVTLPAALIWPTVLILRRLASGDRRTIRAVVAAELAFLIVVLVGLPLQADRVVDVPALAAIMGFHDGIGSAMEEGAFGGMVMLPTTALVFVAADSVILRRYLPRGLRRRLALAALAIVTFAAVLPAVLGYIKAVPPWGSTVGFVDIPVALALFPGLYVRLTDRSRVVDGVALPSTMEPPVPTAARRVGPGQRTRTAGWFRLFFVLAAVSTFLSASPAGRVRLHPDRWSWGLLPMLDAALAAVSQFAVAIGLAVLAVAIGRAARAREMPTAQEVFARDRRPYILYLRSFVDDRVTIRTRRSYRRNYLENYASAVLRLVFVRMRERFEELLVWQLWHHGPVIAVGEPRKPYRAGMPRLYVTREQWRTRIQDLMRSARFVVVVLGRTQALSWELGCLGRLGLMHKVLLVLPPIPERELQARAEAFGEIAACAGVPQPPLHVHPGTLCAVLAPEGTGWRTFSGTHRDEWHYDIAIEGALKFVLTTGRPVPQAPDPAGADGDLRQ